MLSKLNFFEALDTFCITNIHLLDSCVSYGFSFLWLSDKPGKSKRVVINKTNELGISGVGPY